MVDGLRSALAAFLRWLAARIDPDMPGSYGGSD